LPCKELAKVFATRRTSVRAPDKATGKSYENFPGRSFCMRREYCLHKRKNGVNYVEFVDKASGKIGTAYACPPWLASGFPALKKFLNLPKSSRPTDRSSPACIGSPSARPSMSWAVSPRPRPHARRNSP